MSDQRFYSLDDLANLPKPEWLIEGLFERDSLVMLAAPSYSFKSFMAIDWLCHMASGRQWNKRKTVPSKVCYILGEGKASLYKRIMGWIQYHRLTQEEYQRLKDNFMVTFAVPQLAAKETVDEILEDLAEVGFNPTVLVIDTFARSLVGLDENMQKDTGLWIEQADRLRHLGMTVIFLHHTKKNTEFGSQYRGSSAIMAGMDAALLMTRDFTTNRATLEVTKQKDHDEGPKMVFQQVLVGRKEDHTDSMVLVPVGKIEPSSASENEKMEAMIDAMLGDPTFDSDRARAREISLNFTITENGALSRIQRRRKDLEMAELGDANA